MIHLSGIQISLFTTLGFLAWLPQALASAMQPPVLQSPAFQVAQRLRFPVENVESSRGRTGGFARGDACFANPLEAQPPVALVPVLTPDMAEASGAAAGEAQMGLAKTVEAHPSLYIFVPAIGVEQAQFILETEDQSQVLLETVVPLPAESGILQVTVPESVVPLEVGETYAWALMLLCNTSDFSRNALAEGLIQRVPADASLTAQINQADLRDRPAAYANAGIWYDALESLAQLRYADPTNNSLQADWVSLLNSVNLGAIANEPLLAPIPVTPATEGQ